MNRRKLIAVVLVKRSYAGKFRARTCAIVTVSKAVMVTPWIRQSLESLSTTSKLMNNVRRDVVSGSGRIRPPVQHKSSFSRGRTDLIN